MPGLLPYVDPDGTLWPNDGKYCSGAFAIDNVCIE